MITAERSEQVFNLVKGAGMRLRGSISVEHTVWCAHSLNAGIAGDELPFRAAYPGCEHHAQHSGTAQAAAVFARANGWRLTREFGWLCAPCLEAYRVWKQSATSPLDYPCPSCGVPPGVACNIPQAQSMTPRQWDRLIDGTSHRARTRRAKQGIDKS